MIINPHSRIGAIRWKETGGTLTPAMRITDMTLARARAPMRAAPRLSLDEAFARSRPPPGVLPAGMAFDSAMQPFNAAMFNWAAAGAWDEGMTWPGYQYLNELTQRPEYRRPSEILAKEMTRMFIKLKAPSKDGKEDKLRDLAADLRKFKVRDMVRNALLLDGFFGRGHIFIDMGDTDLQSAELATPLLRTKAKIGKGRLKGFRVIEPMWTYPDAYNSANPLAPTFYRPETWFVMGGRINTSRLLTFIGREMPDMLKPVYSFGGLSLSQMAKPYVDNWLRARQSVSDLMHSFSVMVLATDMMQMLAAPADSPVGIERRMELFNLFRDNRGSFLIDKNKEEMSNVSAPIAGLDKLQAQAQEQMASVVGIPLVVLLGITPSGLNASSDGEIRVFYDWVKAQQEDLVRDPLEAIIEILQLNRWGEIDPEITFDFVPLYQLSAKEQAELKKIEAETDVIYVENGIMDADDIRGVLANDDESRYSVVDFSGPAPEPEADLFGEQPQGFGQVDNGEGPKPAEPTAVAQPAKPAKPALVA